MNSDSLYAEEKERAVCALICRHEGLRARDIADILGLERREVNHILYSSPLLRELCYQDRDYQWHGLIRQERPHLGMEEFSGYYSEVQEFLALDGDAWMARLTEGCRNIGRSLNDMRGLLHSFRDCREQMLCLFRDLREMAGDDCLTWEVAFEFRLKRTHAVRIYADVLVISESRVFSIEFKMKNRIDPEEIRQAAKYSPYLEIVFGPRFEVIPVLVLTKAREHFAFHTIGKTDSVIPVCSGDMLFNVFDEYMGFLKQ